MNRKKVVLTVIAIVILIPTLFMTWFLYNLEWKRETIDKSDDGRFKYMTDFTAFQEKSY